MSLGAGPSAAHKEMKVQAAVLKRIGLTMVGHRFKASWTELENGNGQERWNGTSVWIRQLLLTCCLSYMGWRSGLPIPSDPKRT